MTRCRGPNYSSLGENKIMSDALRREHEPNLSGRCRKGLHAGCDSARCECECAHKEKNRET